MIQSHNYSVGTAATFLTGSNGSPKHLHIHSDSNTDIYIGGHDVTVVNGFHLRKDETLQIDLFPTDALYGIAVSPTSVIIMEQQL